ncbi:MAG: hypothetical protein CMH98_15860 [Oceanospirillaceae bacterium]|nr:hypothetical protein [Oceanospirillaceae bacterium]
MRAVSLVMLLCLSMLGHAVTVSDLYSVSVPVEDQTMSSRQAATQMAMKLVVVKVSGISASTAREPVQQAVNAADRYVKSFRFNRDDDNNLYLKVVFAPNLIDKLLTDAHLPVWGKSRPLVLLWAGVEDDQQRRRVSADTPDWYRLFDQALAERGIPVLWPSLDLEDDAALPLERLWGLFRSDIDKASQRYRADAVLAGRMSPTLNGEWRYSGFFEHNGEVQDISARAETADVVLRQVAEQIAASMSSQYAVINDGTTAGHEIRISGVKSFRAYHDLLAYLQANVAVNNVRVRAVHQNDLVLDLDLSADWSQVWATLSLDNRLLLSAQGDYIWQP